ncbi:hypothetical protein QA635_16315 [Bradyrhizobium brasilense]|nr:hypothetical protein [Bradyrhizobium australafricanum]WFU35884.1 hypothetical protein QA635_16315 [Bradyrhizobium australafricanum]
MRACGCTEAKAAGARHNDFQEAIGHTKGSTTMAKVDGRAALA